ncbi:hypothetical protein FIV00_09835 [Labrenzia sp. THAF82]|nr:hypothetical protein FIV00_09835 [Labrenzia sp. THAF82]
MRLLQGCRRERVHTETPAITQVCRSNFVVSGAEFERYFVWSMSRGDW